VISPRTAIAPVGWITSFAYDRAQDQLKQLTRRRAAKLYHWLLEADLALKGSHSQKDRARLAIEMLFLKLAEGMVKAG
jgi:hypothetical protein